MAADRVATLERQLRDVEARSAAEVAALRAELAQLGGGEADGRVRAHEEAAPASGWPRPVRMLLAYQVPTLILALLLAPVPLALVLLPPVAVLLLVAGVVGYVGERRLARAPEPPAFARTLLRHQLCAGILLQAYVVLVAWFIGSFRLFGRGFGPMDVEDFLIGLAIGEGLYVLAVFLPLLGVARRAHAHHRRRWPIGRRPTQGPEGP